MTCIYRKCPKNECYLFSFKNVKLYYDHYLTQGYVE